MEKMTDLRALLLHEIEDLISAEEQIIDGMPAMIEKARNPLLKKSLQQHLRVTEQQLKRIQKVQKMMDAEDKKEGFFSGWFGSSKHECKGTKGIIEEANKTMGEDMDPDVMDAAIIASAQKIEHYEICGYGTAKAYAEELGLREVAQQLEQTLKEEYDADLTLTELALNRVNIEAEAGGDEGDETPTGRSSNGRTKRSATERSSSARNSSAPTSRSNARTSSSSSKTSSGKKSSGGNKKSAAKKSAPKKMAKKGRSTSKSR